MMVDLLIIVSALLVLELVNSKEILFIVALFLMLALGEILYILCFNFGAIGYAVSLLTPMLFFKVYYSWHKDNRTKE